MRVARWVLALTLAALILAAPAQGSAQGIGRAGAAVERAPSALTLAAASCPVGMPVQTLTVVNAANVRASALTLQLGGQHYGSASPGPYWAGQPYAVVDTGGTTYTGWSAAFSHEILEMLADPNIDTYATPVELREVCDPVENWTYRLDGVPVDDFVLPSYFGDGAGPWDEMHQLTGPVVVQQSASGGSVLGISTGAKRRVWRIDWRSSPESCCRHRLPVCQPRSSLLLLGMAGISAQCFSVRQQRVLFRLRPRFPSASSSRWWA